MTSKQVDKSVTSWAREIKRSIKAGDDEREQPHDAIFEAVDSGWAELGFPYGRISEYPECYDKDIFNALAPVLQYVEEKGCAEHDSGLWEGLQQLQILASIAFFSIEQALWEKLREIKAID